MNDTVLLDAGSGGKASQRLINQVFAFHFDNDILRRMDDAALLPSLAGKIVMSADSYTVTPLFFAGGSIGSLAVNGTVNDIAMLGATPLWLACSFIIEEGTAMSTLEAVVRDMADALHKANVKIVTGDTKVVPRGACDQIFINTTGIGEACATAAPSGSNARPGDVILVNGSIGDHGLAVMAARNDLDFVGDVQSDSAPLASLVKDIIATGPVHALRDPTRGGLATSLNEIASQSGVCMVIDESAIPVNAGVRDGCSFLGLDPLYLANEGKLICILPRENAEAALEAMRSSPYGREAAVIGKVTKDSPGKVIMRTRMGGERFLGMLEGALLPRIC